MKIVIISLLMLLLCAYYGHAETYRWTDKQGVIHFTDSPESIPGIYRNKVTKGADITIRNPAVVEELKQQEERAREDAARPRINPTPDYLPSRPTALREGPVPNQPEDPPTPRTKSQRIKDNLQRRALEDTGKPGAAGSGY